MFCEEEEEGAHFKTVRPMIHEGTDSDSRLPAMLGARPIRFIGTEIGIAGIS